MTERRYRRARLVYACGKCVMTRGIVSGWLVSDVERRRLADRCQGHVAVVPNA